MDLYVKANAHVRAIPTMQNICGAVCIAQCVHVMDKLAARKTVTVY